MPTTPTKAERISWPPVLDKARAIVEEYDTPVTLRQLFYRLVAAEELPNTTTAYKSLSSQTAIARREGTFPDLIDTTRAIHRPASFASPQEAQDLASRDLPPRPHRESGRVRVPVRGEAHHGRAA